MKNSRPYLAFAFSALAACGGADSTPEAPKVADGERTEPEAASEDAASDAATQALPWVVTPTSIRYVADEHVVSVQADIDAPDGAKREEPVFIGVTVVTSAGEEIDLMVQTLFPGAFDQGVLFSTSIEGEAQDVLIGVWGTKVEPCEVDRYGCREFGFVLDDSLGSWPKGLYSDAKRRRIPPPEVTVLVHGEGGAAQKAGAVLEQSLKARLQVFGSKAAVTVEAGGDEAPKSAVVTYGHDHDELLATDIANALKDDMGLESVSVASGVPGTTFRVDLQ